MSAAAQVTDSTFKQEVLDSEVPVLVDFWAPWCGPCRMVAPVVDEIAQQYEGQVKVVKVNTDENPNVASQYGIRSIPTLMIFKGGQRVDMVVGAVPKTTLAQHSGKVHLTQLRAVSRCSFWAAKANSLQNRGKASGKVISWPAGQFAGHY